MKRIHLFLALVFTVQFSFAQTELSKAFSESYQHEYNKDYAKAISSLDKFYDANSYEINLRLGWLSYSNGDYLKSQNYYKNAIKIKPSSIEAKLGFAYPTSALENWEDIIKTYNSILAIDPNNYTVNTRMASIYFYRKDFEKAKNYAEIVGKQYPFDYSINLLLGKINVSLGKVTIAKEHLNKALLYNPSSTEVLELLKTL
jgi:tetratricopeptide (TPR) repeat protein